MNLLLNLLLIILYWNQTKQSITRTSAFSPCKTLIPNDIPPTLGTHLWTCGYWCEQTWIYTSWEWLHNHFKNCTLAVLEMIFKKFLCITIFLCKTVALPLAPSVMVLTINLESTLFEDICTLIAYQFNKLYHVYPMVVLEKILWKLSSMILC